MRTIVATVGTSLLSKAGAGKGEKGPSDDELLGRLRQDPIGASAESHTLTRIGLESQDELVFLHTQTPESERCARLLGEYYRREGYRVETRQIDGLNYGEKQFATRGLRSLARMLASAVQDARKKKREPLFCATGGFKPETALAAICGQLLGVEVWYVYETFQEPVKFPPLPIGWDMRLAATPGLREFIEWIQREVRKASEAESWLKQLGAEVRPLVEEEEGLLTLSPLGEVFATALEEGRVAPAADWPEPSALAPEEKQVRKPDHHSPKGTEECCRRLARSPYVVSVETGELENSPASRVGRVEEDGSAVLLYSDGEVAINLYVRTTARGRDQTRMVADYLVRKCLRRA